MREEMCRAYRESLTEAEEEVFLLRCGLRWLMEERGSRELKSLWRLTDYLQQHLWELGKCFQTK